MKKLTISLAIALLLAHGAYASDRAEDREALTQAKVIKWRQLYFDQDAAGLDEFLLDDFVLIRSDGTTRTKAEEVSRLAANPWSGPEDFLFTVVGIIFLGDDAALVYGHGDSTRATSDGVPCAHRYWSSNTFSKVGDTWRPASSHVSGATCVPITDQ